MSDTLELLRKVPVFDGLSDEQLGWIFSQGQEVDVRSGETYARQGDPAEAMFVLLQGEFQWRGEFAGQSVMRDLHAGDVTGTLPFSRMKTYLLNGRALTDGRMFKFPASGFPELVQRMPELATRLVGLMSDRIREATRF